MEPRPTDSTDSRVRSARSQCHGFSVFLEAADQTEQRRDGAEEEEDA